MTFWSQLGMQDAASPMFLMIKVFYEDTMLLLLFLFVWSAVLFVGLWVNPNVFRSFSYGERLEIGYTLYPFIMLMIMGIMSMSVLFMTDDLESGNDMSVKVVGHQWYWSYDYGAGLEFDSYMSNTGKVDSSNFLYLDTDHHMVIVNDCTLRLVMTSDDVLHSWAVPSMGIKMDVIPGRLNTVSMMVKNAGLFFGQCSEICGVNHAFMPICVETLPVEKFKEWALSF